jgi:UDP-N-acetylmuramoyl-L-alanyl-D-glutamate--2,6-diaminopimelate ligase
MAAGAERGGGSEGKDFWREPDRPTAIREAVRRASPGDLVILCGKGHEQSMCFGHVEYDWDDRIALRAALGELLGTAGPDMPHLPTSPGKNTTN